jgi:hypothetical protein
MPVGRHVRKPLAPLLAAGLLVLTACQIETPPQAIDPPASVPSCDCDAPMTDAQNIARTGFTQDADWASWVDFQPGGLALRRVQFDPAFATQAQIDAAPGNICSFKGEVVISSTLRATQPGERIVNRPGTLIIEVLCKKV